MALLTHSFHSPSQIFQISRTDPPKKTDSHLRRLSVSPETCNRRFFSAGITNPKQPKDGIKNFTFDYSYWSHTTVINHAHQLL